MCTYSHPRLARNSPRKRKKAGCPSGISTFDSKVIEGPQELKILRKPFGEITAPYFLQTQFLHPPESAAQPALEIRPPSVLRCSTLEFQLPSELRITSAVITCRAGPPPSSLRPSRSVRSQLRTTLAPNQAAASPSSRGRLRLQVDREPCRAPRAPGSRARRRGSTASCAGARGRSAATCSSAACTRSSASGCTRAGASGSRSRSGSCSSAY